MRITCDVCGDPATKRNTGPRCKRHRKHIKRPCGHWARRDWVESECKACLVGAPISPPDQTQRDPLRSLEAQNQSLRDEIQSLRVRLKDARRQDALFDALAEVIRQEAEPLPPANLPAPRIREHATPVDGVALLSDEHGDQIITAAGTWGLERYNYDVFCCRLQRWTQTVIKYLTVHLPRHQFERLWIFKLGDAVAGMIHGAEGRNHFENTLKAALAVGDAEAQAIHAIAGHVPGGVHVVGVPGNHPRMGVKGKDYVDPHANFDYLVMTQIATRLQADIAAGRVTVHAPQSWTAYVEVRGRLWALNHGDDVRGFAGHPWYGFDRKNNRVQALVARKGMRVSYFAYGHYHRHVQIQSNDSDSFHSGNWSLTDPFAVEALAVGSDPVQSLYVVDDEYGQVLHVPIYVRDEEAEERFHAGQWKPAFGRDLVIDAISEPKAEGFQVIR